MSSTGASIRIEGGSVSIECSVYMTRVSIYVGVFIIAYVKCWVLTEGGPLQRVAVQFPIVVIQAMDVF